MKTPVSPEQEEKEREIAVRFFSLLNPGQIPEAGSLFTPGCRHHNPYTAPGMHALLEEIRRVQQEKRDDMPGDGIFSMRHILADGDLVAVHTTLQSKSDRSIGIRPVHLFRFEGEKIAEYWDITQSAPAHAPYASNMF